jgi:Spy/CpxP family protein refolding chaperone
MFMMRAYRVALTLLALIPFSLAAQEPEPEFAKHLFPPELVMQHQQGIRLTPEQRTSITQGIRDFQLRVVELQWKMQDEAQKLNELVQESRVDEAATIAQVDRVLDVERQIKRAHMGLLIRIKNTLTPAQQDTLAVLRPGKRRD